LNETKEKLMEQVKDDIDIFTFSQLLSEASFWLQKEPENSRILRVMQMKLNKLAEKSANENIQFLSSFLSSYIDKVWTNLAVDFTYQSGKPGREILMNLISQIGKELENLSLSMRANMDYHPILVTLNNRYLETIAIIKENEKLIRDVKFEFGMVTDYGKVPEELKSFDHVVEQSGAITQSVYTLAGGCPSHYFFDADKMMSKGKYVEILSDYYAKAIQENDALNTIDKLAFIEKEVGTVGILPLMGLIISKTGKDGVVVRLQKQVNIGKVKSSRGSEPKKGENVAIISDVATAGEGIIEAATTIRESGANVTSAFVLYDREQGAKETLQKHMLQLHAVASYSKLAEVGLVPKEKGPSLTDQIPMPPTMIKHELQSQLES
jgi:orotate phosphoribosyltransferase